MDKLLIKLLKKLNKAYSGRVEAGELLHLGIDQQVLDDAVDAKLISRECIPKKHHNGQKPPFETESNDYCFYRIKLDGAKFLKKFRIKWFTIITLIPIFLALLGFLGYNSIKDFSSGSDILLVVDNVSAILCEHSVPELNSTKWRIMNETLPERFNFSEYNNYTIKQALHYPWGFILTIKKETKIDLIEPKLIVSYERPNFFYNAYLLEGPVEPDININPKEYIGVSEPQTYNKTKNLNYNLDSRYQTTIFLPDITKESDKILVAVEFLVDLNNDCNNNFSVKFKLLEDIHKIKTKEVMGTIKVIEQR